MNKKGYFGIGCINMQTKENYGTLFRSALIFNADFIFLIGRKFKKMPTDTLKSHKHIPLYEYETFDDFYKNLPVGCKLIGIEKTENSIPIENFKHPKQACYLLGSESFGTPENIISKCDESIQLPGTQFLNVSVAGSIVMFHRSIQK